MYSVYRIANGKKTYLGMVDCPTEIMDTLRPNNRRNLNRSFLIIEPN